MNGNISRKYLSQKVVLGFPFVWRTGSQMLDGWEKEIKLLFRIPFGHEWKDISTRSVTKSCPCFSFWAEKVFVWSWSVVGGQQCSAAATNRNDRGQSPPTDRPKCLLLVNRRKSNEAFPFSRDMLIVLGNPSLLFSPLWICELIAEAFVVRSEAGGRKILDMHRFLWNAHSWTAYAKSTGEKSVKLWILAVMAQTEQLKFEKETERQNEQHQMCKVLLQKVMSEMQRFVPNRSACKYMHCLLYIAVMEQGWNHG